MWYYLKEQLKQNNDEIYIAKKFFGDKKGGTMIDVGACHGTALMPFALRNWEVFGFEPDNENYAVLDSYLRKWNYYKNISISQNAVSNEVKTLKFYKSKESIGISSLNDFHKGHYFSHEVQTTTLDIFTEENKLNNIDFLKIDTEGYDLFVLKGLDFKKLSPSFILCEFEDKKTEGLGYTAKDMVEYLQNQGFGVVISIWHPITKYGESHNWDKFTVNIDDVGENAWGNILAVKQEDYDHLKQIVNIK